MEMLLTFEYHDVGDILYINKVPPYTEHKRARRWHNNVVRRNPRTGAVENREVLFFTRRQFKNDVKVSGLGDLFA